MKTLINITFIIVLFFIIGDVRSQTCQSETDILSTTPDSRFTDNGDGTISDFGTGLMWQKCQLGLSGSLCTTNTATHHTWKRALERAESNLLAGYNDWRLPNHKELLSIVEQRCYSPSINSNYFPNTSSFTFWSASPSAQGGFYTHSVNFNDGKTRQTNRVDNVHVRLVRFEQNK